MNSYIFLVGRSDSHYESATAIRKLGYLVGIFQDIDVPVDDPSKFDIITPTDFSTPTPVYDLPATINIAGLQCTYENYVVAKAKIGKALNVPVISEESADASTDKLVMREAFSRSAPAFSPCFSTATTEDEVLAFAKKYSYPLMLKPTNLVKSLLVLRCNNEQELRDNFSYAINNVADLYKKYGVKDRTPQLIVEQFIVGKLCSIAAFVDHTGTPHFCEGIVGLMTANEYGADDTYLYSRTLPMNIPSELRSKFFAAADAGIRALGMSSTAAHVELIYTDSEVYIIEIGARIGGYRPRMYRTSYGLDLHMQEIRLAIGELPTLTAPYIGPTSVIELFAHSIGTYETITNETDVRQLPSVAYFSIKPTKSDLVGTASKGYKACGIIMLHSKDPAQLAKDLTFVKDNVRVVLAA